MVLMRRVQACIWMCCLSWLNMTGQPTSRVTYFDEEDGLPHSHVTQLLQDSLGFLWLATWNGLCRFDGYEFHAVKPSLGDGSGMTTDRFRDIALRPDSRIVCRVDDAYYLFDTRTYHFSRLEGKQAKEAADALRRYRQSEGLRTAGQVTSFALNDRQGNRWETTVRGLSKNTAVRERTRRLAIEPEGEVKCMFWDSSNRYWLSNKTDETLRVYDGDDDHLIGYLGADGQLHHQYTRFGAAVYCMAETGNGTLWLGCKPKGLYRLRETAKGHFQTSHFTHLPHSNVYSIATDHYGRLWVATMGGGLCYTLQPEADSPIFQVPRHYPKTEVQRVRHLHFTADGNILMAAATDGLLVAGMERDAGQMRFRLHRREPSRAESLSSSATMDIAADHHGRYYVSTESGGVNMLDGQQLLEPQLSFRHYTAAGHQLPNDVVMSLTPMDSCRTMVVGSHLVSIIDTTGLRQVMDAHFFNNDYRFSDAHPLHLKGDRWLFALRDGAFVMESSQMYQQAYRPRVVLTSVSIQGESDLWAAAYLDTLTLRPGQRTLTVRFAALDFSAPERISYAFRLLPNEEWNYIGRNRSATLLDLAPGTYQLQLRSTNAEGAWLDNYRTLTILVEPAFWESAWGQTLLALLVLASLTTIAYTILYIRRIKRKQHETLEAYLALLNRHTPAVSTPEQPSGKPILDDQDDVMLQHVMTFIEQNIGNSDVSVGDMAAFAATSRSGLQRKLKQAMGITPQDLLREARIKHACLLLSTTDKTVAEVAYACGFTDPKYFSRSFKQSVGQSPTAYKNASNTG